MMNISASLVLYNSRVEQFEAVIAAFLAATANGLLYVVDNSPIALESAYFGHARVIYMHNDSNLGFGAAHNRAIRVACTKSDLHLLLNPDILFEPQVMTGMIELFQRDREVMVAMPKVVYPDGSLQRLCKLLPTPVDLIVRRFLPVSAWRRKIDERYELHHLAQDRPTEVPTLSGCFLVARSDAMMAIDGFDERYFMYMEDVDLVRRLASKGKALYLPSSLVVHEYAKGSYRNYRLMGYHIRSAISYFNKWGWFFDRERSRRNRACLESIDHSYVRHIGN